MQWLLLAFGVVGVCGTICMRLPDGLLSGRHILKTGAVLLTGVITSSIASVAALEQR